MKPPQLPFLVELGLAERLVVSVGKDDEGEVILGRQPIELEFRNERLVNTPPVGLEIVAIVVPTFLTVGPDDELLFGSIVLVVGEKCVPGRILEHLDQYNYASREHVVTAILWHTGIRLGSLRAFDLGDFDPEAQCIDLRHRPDTGTPLKNGIGAERSIAVGDHYCQVIEDYIDVHREDVFDDHGRRPLITSREGRLSATIIRRTIYQVTRPCQYRSCPHDREPDECEAMVYHNRASTCPSSRSPHGIRRGSITKHLRDGTPEEIVSDRMNVSSDVLDQHYDRRTEREKMELRRQFIKET